LVQIKLIHIINEINTVRSILFAVREKRIARGYTQEFVAGKLGVSQNGYSKIESGASKITVRTLCMLAEIFEIELIELIIA